MWVRLCLLRLSFVVNVLWQYSHWRGLLSSLSIRVFFFLFFFFLSTLVLHLMRSLTLEIPFHKYYTSYHLLVDQCHLHIIPLQYTPWSVSCFYVLSAYPRSYSDHTNNTYVFEELKTGQGFLNEGINMFFKFLKAFKAPLTLLTIEFFI